MPQTLSFSAIMPHIFSGKKNKLTSRLKFSGLARETDRELEIPSNNNDTGILYFPFSSSQAAGQLTSLRPNACVHRPHQPGFTAASWTARVAFQLYAGLNSQVCNQKGKTLTFRSLDQVRFESPTHHQLTTLLFGPSGES